jgi:NAD(P)-dependent dehydrogenase (short-subunit alcohol dehydrogenase family)
MGKLAGKVAIITGAASGIGRATAELFAREGARVVVADINADEGTDTVKGIRRVGGEAFFVQTDVSQYGEVEKMVEAAMSTYQGLDILVNNAAILAFGTILKTKEEDWDRLMAVNLKGVYLCSKLAAPRIIERGRGVIINVASIGGLVGGPALAAYNASKGGVVLLTKNMAIDLAPYNIRVNCLCPGTALTPMASQIFSMRAKGDADKVESMKEAGLKGYPLRRYGKPEEMAQAILFLASEESAYMTGSSLIVDGGYTAK